MSGRRPDDYYYRMGEIGQMVAMPVFARNMQDKYGKVLRIVDGHKPLYYNLFPVENFDEEAQHLDLVAADMRANLKFWVYGIAEVKSTTIPTKSTFTLNGLCSRFLCQAMRRNIPVYIYVVRFPGMPPDDIITEDGCFKAFMELKDKVSVEVYAPGEFIIDEDTVSILPRDSSMPPQPPKPMGKDDDAEVLARLIEEAQKEALKE